MLDDGSLPSQGHGEQSKTNGFPPLSFHQPAPICDEMFKGGLRRVVAALSVGTMVSAPPPPAPPAPPSPGPQAWKGPLLTPIPQCPRRLPASTWQKKTENKTDLLSTLAGKRQ